VDNAAHDRPEDDIIRDFVRRVRVMLPDVPVMEWRRLEVEFRQEWGGERVYVTFPRRLEP
jgi:hypothetical protein